MKKTLYKINQGNVDIATKSTEWNEETSILAYVCTEAEALHAADLYDQGLLSPDNITIENKTIMALFLCDCEQCQQQRDAERVEIKHKVEMKKRSLAQLIGITLNS